MNEYLQEVAIIAFGPNNLGRCEVFIKIISGYVTKPLVYCHREKESISKSQYG